MNLKIQVDNKFVDYNQLKRLQYRQTNTPSLSQQSSNQQSPIDLYNNSDIYENYCTDSFERLGVQQPLFLSHSPKFRDNSSHHTINIQTPTSFPFSDQNSPMNTSIAPLLHVSPIIPQQTTKRPFNQKLQSRRPEQDVHKSKANVPIEDILHERGRLRDFKIKQRELLQEFESSKLKNSSKLNAKSKKIVEHIEFTIGETSSHRLNRPIGRVKQPVEQPTFTPRLSRKTLEIVSQRYGQSKVWNEQQSLQQFQQKRSQSAPRQTSKISLNQSISYAPSNDVRRYRSVSPTHSLALRKSHNSNNSSSSSPRPLPHSTHNTHEHLHTYYDDDMYANEQILTQRKTQTAANSAANRGDESVSVSVSASARASGTASTATHGSNSSTASNQTGNYRNNGECDIINVSSPTHLHSEARSHSHSHATVAATVTVHNKLSKFDELFVRNARWAASRDERVQSEREHRQQAIDNQCSFHPKLLASSSTSVNARGPSSSSSKSKNNVVSKASSSMAPRSRSHSPRRSHTPSIGSANQIHTHSHTRNDDNDNSNSINSVNSKQQRNSIPILLDQIHAAVSNSGSSSRQRHEHTDGSGSGGGCTAALRMYERHLQWANKR